MDDPPHKGAVEARAQLPNLLDAAARQAPLTPLEGSGRGLWGGDSAHTLRKLRQEWPT